MSGVSPEGSQQPLQITARRLAAPKVCRVDPFEPFLDLQQFTKTENASPRSRASGGQWGPFEDSVVAASCARMLEDLVYKAGREIIR